MTRLKSDKKVTVETTRQRFGSERFSVSHDRKGEPIGKGGKERQCQEDCARKEFQVAPENDEYAKDKNNYVMQIATKVKRLK